jgi:hypothetical protein
MAKANAQKSKSRASSRVQSAEKSSPAWVESMQVHFRETGFYRADDLNRLLGDPRDAVGITVNDGVKIHSLAAK